MNSISSLYPQYKPERQFFLLAGPCVIESPQVLRETASELKRLSIKYEIPLIFKSSFTKANRSSLHSFTGVGDQVALEWLANVGQEFQVPLVTDIHQESDAALAAPYVDMLQIPAFLCRQTSLLVVAAKTGKMVNIKKGQFLSPDSMQFAVQKVVEAGNEQVFITERGTTFGYQDLVVDFRAFPIMNAFGKPTIMDCTHALQQPNQLSGVTGGQPHLIETMAKCGLAAGAHGLFIETHPNPAEAKSDGANMLELSRMDALLAKLVQLKHALQ
ncbi:MAG: 3-deoxy-8-phosphooctulonate synthase [Bacteroidota bacterium]|nr:MAG: 3-deoxy-8-phosphooctulonate synthase [Bacteroidota bacterium]